MTDAERNARHPAPSRSPGAEAVTAIVIGAVILLGAVGALTGRAIAERIQRHASQPHDERRQP